MPLHRLVYYSHNRLGDDACRPEEIEKILETSRRNNVEAGVTGALMFNAGCFAQVLEGEQDVVEATFERIQQDERHGDVSLLSFGPVDQRHFGQWSMGFVGASRRDVDSFAALAAETGFDLKEITGDSLFNLLHGLAMEQEAVAA